MTKVYNQYLITTLPSIKSSSHGDVTHFRWLIGKFVGGDSRPAMYYRVTAVPLGYDMNTNPPKQRYSYVCDCPASVHCKHLDMIGEWLRMGTNRFRYYYDEREGWCEYPKGWFDEDVPQQQSQPMEQSR